MPAACPCGGPHPERGAQRWEAGTPRRAAVEGRVPGTTMPSPRHANASPLCPRQTPTLAEPGRGQATWVRPRGKEGRANGTGVSSASRQAAGLLSRQVTGLRPQAPSSEAASVPKGRGPGSKGLGRGRSCHWGLGPPGESRQPRPADRPRRSQHPPLTAPPRLPWAPPRPCPASQ